MIKNPQTASDKMEYGFVMDFLRRNPNWEQDEVLVHRLKHDTKGARAIGKIHSQWHEWDIPPMLTGLSGLVGIGLIGDYFRRNINKLSSIPFGEKLFYAFSSIVSVYLVAESTKYILTGCNLFEKRK